MKKTNKILSLVMAMVLMCLSMVCVSADDIIASDEYIGVLEDVIFLNKSEEFLEVDDNVGVDEEMTPMIATRCYNYDGAKDENYAAKRGWDDSKINSAINAGAVGTSTNLANGAACTVYCYPGTSYYVVIENISRSIVQLSEFGNDDWIPDSNIVWY